MLLNNIFLMCCLLSTAAGINILTRISTKSDQTTRKMDDELITEVSKISKTFYQAKEQNREESKMRSKNQFYPLQLLKPETTRSTVLRLKRDLAGTSGRRKSIFGQKQNTLISTSLNDYLHVYSISSESFFLNGSANITYKSNGNLRILFDYFIVGEANVSIDVIRSNYQSAFKTHQDPRSIKLQKPRNCHLQVEEKNNITTTKCYLTHKKIKKKIFRKVILPFDNDYNDILNSTKLDQNTEAADNATSDEMQKMSQEKSLPCTFAAVRFVKDWLCVNPSSFPCFSVLIQGQDYKITEKICINQPLFKSTILGIGKLYR